MSANTVSDISPSALLRRFQSLYQTAIDLALDKKRGPDQTANLLSALQHYKDDKPFFLHDWPVMTPFLPVPEDVRETFKELQKVLEIEERHDSRTGSWMNYDEKRPLTVEELAWIFTTVKTLSLPVVATASFGTGHLLGIIVYDHAVTWNETTYKMKYEQLLFFTERNHPNYENLGTIGGDARQMEIYKLLIEQLAPDEAYEQVRAFYGFAPLPKDARPFSY